MEWGSNAFDSKRRTVRGIWIVLYLGTQAAADEGCESDVVHKIKEGYRAWRALKSVLIN